MLARQPCPELGERGLREDGRLGDGRRQRSALGGRILPVTEAYELVLGVDPRRRSRKRKSAAGSQYGSPGIVISNPSTSLASWTMSRTSASSCRASNTMPSLIV